MLPSPVRLTMRPRWAAMAGVDGVAAQPPQARKGPVLVGAGEPALSDDARRRPSDRMYEGVRLAGKSEELTQARFTR